MSLLAYQWATPWVMGEHENKPWNPVRTHPPFPPPLFPPVITFLLTLGRVKSRATCDTHGTDVDGKDSGQKRPRFPYYARGVVCNVFRRAFKERPKFVYAVNSGRVSRRIRHVLKWNFQTFSFVRRNYFSGVLLWISSVVAWGTNYSSNK